MLLAPGHVEKLPNFLAPRVFRRYLSAAPALNLSCIVIPDSTSSILANFSRVVPSFRQNRVLRLILFVTAAPPASLNTQTQKTSRSSTCFLQWSYVTPLHRCASVARRSNRGEAFLSIQSGFLAPPGPISQTARLNAPDRFPTMISGCANAKRLLTPIGNPSILVEEFIGRDQKEETKR
jgi:hypothetical protein